MPCVAIIVSYGPMGVPHFSRYARNLPNLMASSEVNGIIVKAERNKYKLSLVLVPHLLLAAPYSNLPTVMAEI